MRYKRKQRWDRGLRGWIVNTATKNFWRVSSWYDIEDLIQDGYVCYARCQQRYTHVTDQKHFMSLVKVTYVNHIHDLAQKRSQVADLFSAEELTVSQQPVEAEETTFLVLVMQLPRELQDLLKLLMNDAKSIPHIKRTDGTRETTNEYYCRLIGANPEELNIEQIFRAHFAP